MAAAGGGLLIAEKLLNEDGVGPLAANMQSLNMLVVTEGKERSLREFETITTGSWIYPGGRKAHGRGARRNLSVEIVNSGAGNPARSRLSAGPLAT